MNLFPGTPEPEAPCSVRVAALECVCPNRPLLLKEDGADVKLKMLLSLDLQARFQTDLGDLQATDLQKMDNEINLLFADDEEKFLEAMTKRLEARAFPVIAVTRGDKALEAARSNPVDIALLDLRMPGMNGEETLKALKQEHKWMEIVILTGHGNIDSAVELTKIGAHSYLQKPCDLDQLMDALQEAYKKRVMNKTQIEAGRMDQLLKIAQSSSPSGMLRRLREIGAWKT
jgi:DNA-binding NtrC family response regulator